MPNVISDLYGKRKGHAMPAQIPSQMPSPKSVEEEFADYVPQAARQEATLEGSHKMEKMKGLLTTGLSAAYKDGATALEAAIKDADDQVTSMQAQCKAQIAELDAMKRAAADYLIEHTNAAKELSARLATSVQQLHTMTKWVEEQRDAIRNPAPPVALPPPPEPPEPSSVTPAQEVEK